MKFYWKIFISFFILIATAFSICGTWMISASFRASYHREIESGNSKNEMVRMSLGNIVGSMPADYFTKHKNAMKEICSSFAVSFGGIPIFSQYMMTGEALFTPPENRRTTMFSLLKQGKTSPHAKYIKVKIRIIYVS